MKKQLALAIVAIACLFGTACFAKDTYQFEILSTTDMHGRATNYNVATQKEDLNSMVRVASVVERERKVFGDNLILIDNGDLLQGTLLSQYAITQKPKEEKKQLLDIMNSEGAYHNGFTIIITLLGILAIIGFFIGVFGGLISSNSFLTMFGIGCLISVVIISICSNTYNTSKLKQYYKENEDIEIMEDEEETWKL